jgi:serine/threonine protein kinase
MTSDTLHGPGDVILKRYELVRMLGSGGWGRVYLANDRMLHRPVAIKQLLPRLAADPAAVSRFMREASVIASIRDPHVLTIYDVAESEGQHYMVMEYADSGTLAQMLQLEGAMSPYEALSVAIDVCKGLRAVHSKGVVHRDVKPANVMFFSRTDGLPIAKIGDFGIALQQEEERLTPSDNVVGTLIYLSPEQASASNTITHASDLYSLGVVLYEMMSGELRDPLFANPLFANDNSSEVYQQLGMFPEPVRPLLIKALRRKAEDRFQRADEMLQALERSRSRLTVSFATQAFGPAAPVALPESTTTGTKPQFPARLLLAVVAISLILLVGGAIAALGLGTGSVEPTASPTFVPLVAANPTSTRTPTATFTPIPTPTPTVTLTPSSMPTPASTPTSTSRPTSAPTSTSRPTPTSRPSPTPKPTTSISTSSPSPSPAVVVTTPTRVTGAASLTLLLRDTYNVPEGTYAVGDDPPAEPIAYLDGRYVWGEVATRIGDTVFKINRDAPDPDDPTQHLPSHLRLNIVYSAELLAAMKDTDKDPPGFDRETGEFWVGRFQCGSAVAADSSPYWISVQLLENDQEIASGRYVIGVLNNPDCEDESSEDGGPGGPPTRR